MEQGMTRRPNILFIDDEPNILDGLRRQLRPYKDNWEMSFHDTAIKAITYVKEHPVDVIVTDIQMPQISGDILINAFKDLRNPPAFIVLSGQSSIEEMKRRIKADFLFLEKPSNFAQLTFAISQMLQRRNTHPGADRHVLELFVEKMVSEKITKS